MSFFSWQVFQKCFIRVQKEVLRKKVFLKKIDLFYCHFRTLSEKPLVLCRHVFGRIVKTAIYLLVGTFWWSNFISKKIFSLLFILGYWAKKFRTYSIFFRQMSELRFRFPMVNSEEESSIEKKLFFQYFWTLSGILSDLCRDVLGMNFKTAFNVFKKVHWGNCNFFKMNEFFFKYLVILSKNCSRIVFLKTIFFHFRSMSKILSAFVDFFSAWLLKLRSTCPWDLFERKQFFFKKFN